MHWNITLLSLILPWIENVCFSEVKFFQMNCQIDDNLYDNDTFTPALDLCFSESEEGSKMTLSTEHVFGK